MKISKFKKVWICLLVAVLMMAGLSGCSSPDSDSGDTGNKDGALSDVTIGACVMSLQHEYMINLVKGYTEFQKQTGLDLIVTDGGNMEPEKQVTNVENFIEQGVDGIVVQAISINTMKDIFNRAHDAGIKVAYYPYMDGINADAYLGYDEYEWGSKLGVEASKWIKERLDGKATILSLETSLEENSIVRAQGWKDVIAKEFSADAVKLVTVEATSSENAMSAIESALQANPDAQMVLSYNDEMGLGAYEAVVQSNVDKTNFFIGSCDGTDTVLDLVEQDTPFRCTIGNAQLVSEIGFYWLQNIVKAAVGLECDYEFQAPTMALDITNIKDYRARQPEYVLDADLVEYMESL